MKRAVRKFRTFNLPESPERKSPWDPLPKSSWDPQWHLDTSTGGAMYVHASAAVRAVTVNPWRLKGHAGPEFVITQGEEGLDLRLLLIPAVCVGHDRMRKARVGFL